MHTHNINPNRLVLARIKQGYLSDFIRYLIRLLMLYGISIVLVVTSGITLDPTPLTPSQIPPPQLSSIGFAQTSGGDGGEHYVVTTLEDAIPAPEGSLRAAIEAEGKRTITFEVSGWIDLVSRLQITSPEITIDGSTAPNKGVGLRVAEGVMANPMVMINTHDVIIRYLRLRPGSRGHEVDVTNFDNPGFYETDAILITGNNGEVASNIWLDHIDASGASDGNVEIWGPDAHHITISNSYIFQGLRHSTHSNVWEWSILENKWVASYSHSMASLVGNGAHDISYINNVFAHNGDRVPLFLDVWNIELINNLIYNSINTTIKIGFGDPALDPTGEWKVNFIGNRVLNNGLDTNQSDGNTPRYALWALTDSLNIYFKSNISQNRPDNSLPETDALYPQSVGNLVANAHELNISEDETIVLDTDANVIALLNSAGVTLPQPDSLHQQIKTNIINALANNPTGRIIDHVGEADYPVLDE